MADGVHEWLVNELAVTAGPMSQTRERIVTTIPATTSWVPAALLEPTGLMLSSFAPNRPELAWTYAGSGAGGDAVFATWFDASLSGTGPSEWTFWLSPGTTEAVFPALPAAMQPLVPATESTSVNVSVASGADPVALFGFAWEEVEYLQGEGAWLP